MSLKEIPNERLRVFISSAQSIEGSFEWDNVRRRIKDYLKECPYLNPFIIEDVASNVPSTQFYQMQLIRSDIVVLLVKGEVREGTAVEYALAIQERKPLLVYFLVDDKTPDENVKILKEDLRNNDYCTYRKISVDDNIEHTVRADVIESVIRHFQSIGLQREAVISSTEATSLPSEQYEYKHGVPTKTSIELFSSSYSYIFDLLDISKEKEESDSEQSALHNLGIAALDWLVTGQGDISSDNISDLIYSVSDLYSDTEWLKYRWDAIRYEIDGDSDSAIKAENEALVLARTSEMPPWIIANILIDCRNIENEISSKDRKPFSMGNGQKDLNELDTIVYLPVLDRYLGNVYDALAKEEEKYKMAKPGTMFWGTNFGSIINDVENYFFTAMLYGSYTHMLIARDLLAKVLYKYNELIDDELLLFNYIKLLIIHGNKKAFKNTMEHRWDDLYLWVTSNADELWHLTDRVNSVYRDSMKRTVMTTLGMYLTDYCFSEAEAYLKSVANEVYWGISEDFFDCLLQNIIRLNAIVVTEILTEIISARHFHMGRKLSNVLSNLNIDNVPNECQIALCESLEENLSFIINMGGHPQFIAALVMQNKEVFEVLASVPGNGLQGTEKIFYDSNTGNGDWNHVILDQIEIAKKQFQVNNNPSTYCGFAEKPYATIKHAIREHYSVKMASIINSSLIPLCIDVLNSQVPADVKNECIDCLCDALVYSDLEDIELTQQLAEAINKINLSGVRSIMENSKSVLEYRVFIIKIVLGIADKEGLINWCFEFSKKDSLTKVALAECIEQYLRKNIHAPFEIDAMILSIVFQCFEDEYWLVRKIACRCLAYMLSTRYKEQVELKLYEGASDSSHYVRDHLLKMCKKGEINNISISNRIIDIMKNDANYAIRRYANS